MKREEIKFIINDKDKNAILDYLKTNAKIDPYCTDGKYYIQTIYVLSWRTNEFKGRIRLRKYITGDSISYFLENKYKDKFYKYKNRLEISQNEYQKIQESKEQHLLDVLKKYEDICFFLKQDDLDVKTFLCNVSYCRNAYVLFQGDKMLRITIDSFLQTEINNNVFYLLDKNNSILEIKGKHASEKCAEMFDLEKPIVFNGSKFKLSQSRRFIENTMYNDIIENELKLELPNCFSFTKVYDFLSEKYLVKPLDYSVVSDVYYDTEDLYLYHHGCSFRCRKKHNISLNFKTKGEKYLNIWSRREYRDEISKAIVGDQDIFQLYNKTIDVLNKYSEGNNLKGFKSSCTIISKRISYIIQSKEVDETQKANIIGVCTFDSFFDFDNPMSVYKEFEVEACNSLVSPQVFFEMVNIGKELCLEFPQIKESTCSKYERIMANKH